MLLIRFRIAWATKLSCGSTIASVPIAVVVVVVAIIGNMMDERLIAEVQKHAIIYNRQKSNMINGDKCITKEIAWQDIARNLASDGTIYITPSRSDTLPTLHLIRVCFTIQ